MQELSRAKIRDVKSRLNYGGFEVFHFTGMNYRSSPFAGFFVLLPLGPCAICTSATGTRRGLRYRVLNMFILSARSNLRCGGGNTPSR